MTHILPSVGDRIRLLEMPKDPCPIEPGSLGTVSFVSPGPGQIGVKWDSGRTLHLVIGVDVFEIVTQHRVVLIEDNSYARYDVFVEATDPDQAAGIAREMVVDGKADGGSQHFRDDALPYVTDVIDAAGEECAFGAEHGHDGVVTPDLLATRTEAASAVSQIDDFRVETEDLGSTDTGVVWELLNRLRDELHATLPVDVRAELDQALADNRKELAERIAEHDEAVAADHAQHAYTVSA